MMLPYMEQTTIYNAINFSVVSESNNYNDDLLQLTATTRSIAAFLCPSNQVQPYGQWSAGPAGRSYIFPGNTYFASVGSGMNQYGNSPYAELAVGSAAPNGLFQVFGPAIGIQSVTDGTSNTIAMGEWITGSNGPTLTLPQDVVRDGRDAPRRRDRRLAAAADARGRLRLQQLAPAVCPADPGDECHGQPV